MTQHHDFHTTQKSFKNKLKQDTCYKEIHYTSYTLPNPLPDNVINYLRDK